MVTMGRLDVAHHMNTSDFGEMRIVDTPLTEIGGIDVMSCI